MEVAGVQSGIVTNNQDPDQMGRVQVSFPDSNTGQSAWARVVQPMAGSNYGVYFVPEVGDEVLVAFLQNNQDHPVIIGSLFNQGQSASYNSNNYIKNIKTKGGNEIRLTDTDGQQEILITNPNTQNQISLNMADNGKITIQSQGKIELTAPEIDLSANQTFSIKGGEVNISGTKISVKSDGDLELAGMQSKLNGTASLNMGAPQVNIKADAQLEIDGGAMATIKSDGVMSVQSSGETSLQGAVVMIN